MKWYVAIDKVDWADEFDLPFGELMDEPTYKKIDNDIIDKEDIQERRYGRRILKENFYKMPFDKFATYVDRYAKFLKDEDED